MTKKTNTKREQAAKNNAASTSKTGKPAPKATSHREVTFAVYEPRAEQVFVCGAFNDWQAAPLTRQENRDWKTTLALAPGRYEYKFVVDGKWKIDPRAAHSTPNGLGSLNSVVEVTA